MKQLLLDIAPPSPPTLANFVPGRNRELSQTLDDMLVGKERFVYLWGATGCGRSHLLQAVIAAATRNQLNAVYIECDSTDNTDNAFAAASTADCVAVDDVERLSASTQIGLFNLYNRMRDEDHARLLVSGPVAPAQLKLREDLVTRLGWGLVYQVHELTDEEKVQAMQSHAASRGFDLPQEVSDYLLRHGRRDMPSLIAMLDALDRHSLANQRQITVPLLRELLRGAP
ncbi:MAG: DnaA regulatory inactivator Hda [Nitrosomonadaceae bacterium]|nr:MAG: DnaA regulatory inactivator Hda [Nitrosomonadaceae bacterium]